MIATQIHTLTTLLGMRIFCYSGIFEYKRLSAMALAPLAGAYVGYVVLNNLNLRINTVRAGPGLCSQLCPCTGKLKQPPSAGGLLSDIEDSCGACSSDSGGHLLWQACHEEGAPCGFLRSSVRSPLARAWRVGGPSCSF